MTASPTEKTTSGWVPEVDTFAKRLVLVRLKMGWHNADAASREYALPKESYRDWEKGKFIPRNLLNICHTISQRTGVDFGWLYGGEGMAGEAPSEEAMKWLRMSESGARQGGSGTNGDYGLVSDQPMPAARPPDNRPTSRPSTGGVGPGFARPARLPRPRVR